MKIVYSSRTIAVAALTVWMTGIGAAQQSAPEPQKAPEQSASEITHGDSGTPITLVGCIQGEADYRRATGAGTGGVGGFGLGLADEFVLINSVRSGTAPATAAREGSSVNDIAAGESPCPTDGGEAFELTGALERELGRFVGRRVEIVGVLKPGTDAPVGTSGTQTRTDTTGLNKLNPWDQDLELQEVEITSFSDSLQ